MLTEQDLPIQKPKKELTLADMQTNLFYAFNHCLSRDLLLNKTKRNSPEQIQVLNPDGTVNPNLKYNTEEYRTYMDAYVKQYDNGPLKIFNDDGTRNTVGVIGTREVKQPDGSVKIEEIIGLTEDYKKINDLYSTFENRLLRLVPKNLTMITEGDPNFKLDNEDGCEVKFFKESDQYGIINPGQKDLHSVLGKLSRLAINKAPGLNMDEAIDKNYHNKEAELINEVSDHARFSVILKNYKYLYKIVTILQYAFGGLPKINDINHGKPNYESVHLNIRVGNVNAEIQIHSITDMNFKLIDDLFYHAIYGNKIDSRSDAGIELNWIKQLIQDYAQELFSRDCFQSQVPQIEEFIKDCQDKGCRRAEAPAIKNIGICYGEASEAQKLIVERLTTVVRNLKKVMLGKGPKNLGLHHEDKLDGKSL